MGDSISRGGRGLISDGIFMSCPSTGVLTTQTPTHTNVRSRFKVKGEGNSQHEELMMGI